MKKSFKILAAVFLFTQLHVGVAAAATGGPDEYGYVWTDSHTPSPQISYNWIDISATGTNTGMYGGGGEEGETGNGDNSFLPVNLEFPFTLYGNTYTTVNISTNGFLSFTDDASEYWNTQLPSEDYPNNVIAPFWDHLYINYSAKIFYQTLGTAPNRIFVAQWSNARFCCWDNALLTFEVLLYEQGNRIVFQYNTLQDGVDSSGSNGRRASVGIENADGTIGLQYSYNSPVLSPGFAIEFMPVLVLQSTFPAGQDESISLNANIRAQFNQPLDAASLISTSLTATGSGSGPIPGTLSALPAFNSLEFNPTTDFTPGETITVVIPAGLRALNGTMLDADYTWSFTSADRSLCRPLPVRS
jgi:hypothetical protein